MIVNRNGLIRALILSILAFVFLNTSAYNTILLSRVEILEEENFSDERTLNFIQTQIGTRYEEVNCFYSVLSTIINNKVNYQKWSPDSLRINYHPESKTGASFKDGIEILIKEKIDFNIFLNPTRKSNILKILDSNKMVVVPVYLNNSSLHSIMITDYQRLVGDKYVVRYFDPNLNNVNMMMLEYLEEQAIPNLIWIGIN